MLCVRGSIIPMLKVSNIVAIDVKIKNKKKLSFVFLLSLNTIFIT
jgi:hypothetical protein